MEHNLYTGDGIDCTLIYFSDCDNRWNQKGRPCVRGLEIFCMRHKSIP